MERKRKNIPAGVRWKVLERDGFKCIYCGATKATANLVIDHGDPFSKGGDDDVDNYVTACRECNAGKASKVVIPPAAWANDGEGKGVVRNGIWHRSQLLSDWYDALRHASASVHPGVERSVASMCDCLRGSKITTDFLCEMYSHESKFTHVVIIPLRDRGTFTDEEKARFRDGAILGYSEPTMLLMGSPWHFYGVVVNERHKGCAYGSLVNEYLSPSGGEFYSSWYPDENWDFYDIRDEHGIRPFSVAYRAWHMTAGEAFDELRGKESSDGI